MICSMAQMGLGAFRACPKMTLDPAAGWVPTGSGATPKKKKKSQSDSGARVRLLSWPTGRWPTALQAPRLVAGSGQAASVFSCLQDLHYFCSPDSSQPLMLRQSILGPSMQLHARRLGWWYADLGSPRCCPASASCAPTAVGRSWGAALHLSTRSATYWGASSMVIALLNPLVGRSCRSALRQHSRQRLCRQPQAGLHMCVSWA